MMHMAIIINTAPSFTWSCNSSDVPKVSKHFHCADLLNMHIYTLSTTFATNTHVPPRIHCHNYKDQIYAQVVKV